MSGPPYPPGPGPGSNAIGQFIIGVSPIGTISAFDVWRTVISQYANSPRLTGIVGAFALAADLTIPFEQFFDKIWNIYTAEGRGLDVWGRIVGVDRVVEMVEISQYFGFEEGEGQPFGQASFFAGAPLTTSYRLEDGAYRTLILAKAMSNICDGSIPAINRILQRLFSGRGNAYVREGSGGGEYFGFDEGDGSGFNQQPFFVQTGGSQIFFGFSEAGDGAGFDQAPFYIERASDGMRMEYVFEFKLSAVELAIVRASGALPTPAGVTPSIVQVY